MSTKHLLAAAALAALGAGAVAQQGTTRMDMHNPSADSRSDMRDSRGDMSGTPAGSWDERDPSSSTNEVGPTVQPMSDRTLSRSDVQQEAREAARSPDESDLEFYGGD